MRLAMSGLGVPSSNFNSPLIHTPPRHHTLRCRLPEASYDSFQCSSVSSQSPPPNGPSPPSQPSQPHGRPSRSTSPPRTRPSSTSRSSTTSSRPPPNNQPCFSCTQTAPASLSDVTRTPGSRSTFPSCTRPTHRLSVLSAAVVAAGPYSMIWGTSTTPCACRLCGSIATHTPRW